MSSTWDDIKHTRKFRQILHKAFLAGADYNSLARGTWDAPSFDEWFSENFGGILEAGNISPEDRKTEQQIE
jgi:hypothetical protein